jgi:elongator complex protein 2
MTKNVDQYELMTKNSTHLRIIWSCSWSFDDKIFATGSRDKTINLWKTSDHPDLLYQAHFIDGVTAVSFSPTIYNPT